MLATPCRGGCGERDRRGVFIDQNQAWLLLFLVWVATTLSVIIEHSLSINTTLERVEFLRFGVFFVFMCILLAGVIVSMDFSNKEAKK